MTEQLAESGLIWNCHQSLVKCSVRAGREHGSMRSQPIHNQTLGTVRTSSRSQCSLFSVWVCVCVCVCVVWVGVCGLHASAGADHAIETVLPSSLSLSFSLSLNPVYVIDPRLDIWVASSDSYRFYLLGKPSTASRWGRHSRVQVCFWEKKKKCNALMSLPYKNQAATREEAYTQPVTHSCHSVKLTSSVLLFTLCQCLFTWLLCVWTDVCHHRVTRWFTVVEKYTSSWRCSSAASRCHICSKLSCWWDDWDGVHI